MQHRLLDRSKRMIGIVERVHFHRHHVPLGDDSPRARLDVFLLRLSLSDEDQRDRQASA